MGSIEDIYLHQAVVAAVVPDIYEKTAAVLRAEGGTGLYVEPSHSPHCGPLTSMLLTELRARHLPCKRELHETSEGWHFIIVHALEGDEPSPVDLMTDLNPWQYGPPNKTGYLHGTRMEIGKILTAAGVHYEACKLRDLKTITIPHTTAPSPAQAYREAP